MSEGINKSLEAFEQRDPPPTGMDREQVRALVIENHSLAEDNRKLKAALGHADAALDGFGGDKELVEALEEIVEIAEQLDFTSIIKDTCDADDKTDDIEMIARDVLAKYKEKK
jgi:hypothetical protein